MAERLISLCFRGASDDSYLPLILVTGYASEHGPIVLLADDAPTACVPQDGRHATSVMEEVFPLYSYEMHTRPQKENR